MEQNPLSAMLENPEALQNAIGAISGALGGSLSQNTEGEPAATQAAYDPSAELMGKLLPAFQQVMSTGQTAVSQDKRALLNAIKPFVTPEVAAHFDHAVKLVSLSKMAQTALGQLGQEGTPATEPEEL